VDGAEQCRVRAHERGPLVGDQPAAGGVTGGDPLVGVAHRERPLGRSGPDGAGGNRVDVAVERGEGVDQRALVGG
jgi:hypothetical protein